MSKNKAKSKILFGCSTIFLFLIFLSIFIPIQHIKDKTIGISAGIFFIIGCFLITTFIFVILFALSVYYSNIDKFNKYVWYDKKRSLFGLPLTFTRYYLSEDKLMIDNGFLTIRQDEIRLYRILDLSLTRSIFQRMFRLGTIECHSSDKSMKNFKLENIKNPEEIKNKLSDMVEKERVEKRVSSRELIGDTFEEETDEND